MAASQSRPVGDGRSIGHSATRLEYGLHVEAAGETIPDDPRHCLAESWHDALPDGRWTALYFGSEFCEHLIPSFEAIRRACAQAEAHGFEAALLTPIVRPAGLERIGRLLARLDHIGLHPSVVFNDWGVLQLLSTRFRAFPRRAGKLLNRELRDPRLVGSRPADNGPPDRGQAFREFLRDRAVHGIESDVGLEGGFLGPKLEGFLRVLHLPFSFVASGRMCLYRSEFYGGTGSFAKDFGLPCHGPCLVEGPRAEQRPDGPSLTRAGNTVFREVGIEEAVVRLAEADRLVVRRRPSA